MLNFQRVLFTQIPPTPGGGSPWPLWTAWIGSGRRPRCSSQTASPAPCHGHKWKSDQHGTTNIYKHLQTNMPIWCQYDANMSGLIFVPAGCQILGRITKISCLIESKIHASFRTVFPWNAFNPMKSKIKSPCLLVESPIFSLQIPPPPSLLVPAVRQSLGQLHHRPPPGHDPAP